MYAPHPVSKTPIAVIYVVIIIVVGVVGGIFALQSVVHPYSYGGCPASCDYGIRVTVSFSPYKLSSTGLDAASINNITNGTFTIQVSALNLVQPPTTIHLRVDNGSLVNSDHNFRLMINQTKQNYMTSVETVNFRLWISSNDPDIQAMNIWGGSNNQTIKAQRTSSHELGLNLSNELQSHISAGPSGPIIAMPLGIDMGFRADNMCKVC